MPLSRADTYPRVINYLWDTNPQSILDCGIGFGGMGVLMRQVSDIRWGRIFKKDWEVQLDGIEINVAYENKNWWVYDDVKFGDISEILPRLSNYDVIFFGDVLEHFDKETALKLIDTALSKANKSVIITTPASFSGNEAEAERFNNNAETHRCLLEITDFPPDAIIETYNNQRVIILEK